MKLKAHTIPCGELQDWLDKYQEKIKFVLPHLNPAMGMYYYVVVIDEA